MTTDKTPATLATAKPGGCVQLGDQLPPLPKTGYVTGGDFGHEAHNAFTPEQMQDYARAAIAAALSAQPSPGGQGDALLREVSVQLESLDCGACIGSDAPMEDLHGRIAAHLAARQPVGERPLEMRICELRHVSLKPNRPYVFTVDANCAKCRADAAYALGHTDTKPAQAVDLGAEPMFYIQDTRQFVGNCPMWWGPNGRGYVTRLDEAGRYTEQEAIKQNRTRDTDIPWPCAEIDAIARHTVDFQHMRPRAERLAELALLDSQAVGNG